MRATKFDYRVDLDDGRIGVNNLGFEVEIGFQGTGKGHDRRRYQRIKMSRKEFEKMIHLIRVVKGWEQ